MTQMEFEAEPDEAPKGESPFAVVLIGLFLVGLALLCVTLWTSRGETLGGEEIIAELFEGGTPEGYWIETAHELGVPLFVALAGGHGDRVVTLHEHGWEPPVEVEDEADDEEASGEASTDDGDGGDDAAGEADADGGLDDSGVADEEQAADATSPEESTGSSGPGWRRPRVEEIREPRRPHTLHLVLYTDPEQVTEQFTADSWGGFGGRGRRGRGGGEWGGFGEDGHMVVERGELEWGRWRASYARDRAFLEEGHFEETVRVNLSSTGQLGVLYATWPRDHVPALEELATLLEAWSYRSS